MPTNTLPSHPFKERDYSYTQLSSSTGPSPFIACPLLPDGLRQHAAARGARAARNLRQCRCSAGGGHRAGGRDARAGQ
eukprot:5307197-Prymnesium_polylepis.1